MLKHGKFKFPRWNYSYRASKSRRNTDMWEWKHVKMNWYIPANIYICSLCLFILPPLFDKCSGCYSNSLFDIAKKTQILKHFWQRRSHVIRNSCKWRRNFKAWGPWATNNEILVRILLYISRFLGMSFCKGYSSRFNTSPTQFSLFEFLYMISLASKSVIVYVLDDCHEIWNVFWQIHQLFVT